MPRRMNCLTILKINALKRRGLYGDGGGLYLAVAKGGSKAWVFRYKKNGKVHHLGLGGYSSENNLQRARERASAARLLLLDGVDPIAAKHAKVQAQDLEAAKAITFKQCAEGYISAHRAGWRNAKHAAQWDSSLASYAYPVLEKLPVGSIDTALVLKVLEPIWARKTETASRLRGRVESILDWARVRGYRNGENPARWRGHLDKLLPRRSKLQKIEHLPALPWPEIGSFMSELRADHSLAARGLEFTILTAGRSGEIVGARWPEIDLVQKLWVIPAERMKGGREHRVPLVPRALAILNSLPRDGDTVFPVSDASMRQVLRRLGRKESVHGFRSCFRDWCRERTSFPREIAELCLAHANRDRTEAAYARGDAIERRRQLMEAWATFCAKPARPGEVVSITRTVRA
jgi:integrase